MFKTKNLGLNITEMPQDKSVPFRFDVDLGDNFEAIDEMTVSHRNITNCILEVPQDIKVECTNGTITVKAGSKIWIPYGNTQVYKIGDLDQHGNIVVDTSFQNNNFFYAIKLQEDKSNNQTNPDAINRICWFNLSDDVPNALQAHSSGTIGYTEGYNQFYYFTNANYAKMYLDGVQSEKLMSLPICIVKGDGVNMYASVEQVFNGFGHIGSTVFALPGVKGLIPNGRNEDGSLNNKHFTVSNVLTTTRTTAYNNYDLVLNTYEFANSNLFYDKVNNLNKKDNGIIADYIVVGKISASANGVITSFTPKQPFKAVDFNDYHSKITELEAKIKALQEALQG